MNLIDTASFKDMLDTDSVQPTIFFITAKESDLVSVSSELNKNISKMNQALLEKASFLSLESIQSGKLPDLSKETPLYIVCDHGHISELAALYLEVAGFPTVYNVEGGLQALESIS